MEDISFQYPTWLILICFLAGLLYAVVLYFRSRMFRDYGDWARILLGALRFTAIALIGILLLAPLIKSLLTETRKPVVVIAQDVSESVGEELDSLALQNYRAQLQELEAQLADQFEVVELSFGEEVRAGIEFQFEDKVSNISNVLTEIYDLYSNQNLGAVILATDGIYNEGSNPLYTGNNLNAPVYSVALGDTIPRKDLVVKRVFHNQIAYLGDRFSIQVDINALNSAGSLSSLTVSRVTSSGTRVLERTPVNIDQQDFFQTRELLLNADEPGVQRYRITLAGIEGELTLANNSRDIFVDVLDARQKILLLAHAPHPDLTALKQTILGNKNYEVETAFAQDFTQDVRNYDFVILHQLPAVGNPASNLINRINQANIPHLFIVGLQSDLQRFNQLQPLLSIRGDGRNTNEVQAHFAPNFSLFTVDERLQQELPQFAPLTAPFGDFQEKGQGQVLLYQQIGKVKTQYPLLMLGEKGDTKVGVLAAEGVWKWRLFDYLQNENHKLFDELISKTIQYLSIKEDKRRFRVNPAKNIFNENENIILDAELYNESFELINEPDVSITITDAEGKSFDYVFSKSGNAYQLDAGRLPVGDYRFRATVNTSGKTLTADGQFSVQPIQLESYEMTARHGLLRLLSQEYGGQLLYPEDMSTLPGLIAQQESAKPVIYQSVTTQSVIHFKWLFVLIAGLLALEWFLRRYFGGY